MSGAEELPYGPLRPVWSGERLFLWQPGPRTAPGHGSLQTDPGQSNSRREGAVGAGRSRSSTGGRAVSPHTAGSARSAPPRCCTEGRLRAAGPARPGCQCPPCGHRGAPSRHRASLPAVRRVPSALLHNRRLHNDRRGCPGPAAVPAAERGEGRGPPEPLSRAGGAMVGPSRVTSATCAVSGTRGWSEQLPCPSLPFPSCLLPSFPSLPCPPSPHGPLTIAAPSAQPAGPVAGLLLCALFFFFFLSLPPCLPARPGSEYRLSRPEPASLKGAAAARAGAELRERGLSSRV